MSEDDEDLRLVKTQIACCNKCGGTVLVAVLKSISRQTTREFAKLMEIGCEIKLTNVIVARTHKWCQEPCEGMWPEESKKQKQKKMRELKKRFAKKMLDEKLDFLPLEESLQLKEAGIELKTKFSWVCNVEEIGDEFETDREFVNEALDFYGPNGCEIGNGYSHYEEFTHEICPAPTYIDLIK